MERHFLAVLNYVNLSIVSEARNAYVTIEEKPKNEKNQFSKRKLWIAESYLINSIVQGYRCESDTPL